jgi:APA family basic amino acid/polyamine antiporter
LKKLSFLDATLLVSGSMIGSGIFIVSAQMARDLGSSGWLLLLWLISGLITITAALSYGELAGMMPKAGGQYVYLQRAFNKLVAFLYGWTVFAVIQTGVIAAVAVAFAKYAGVFFPVLNTVIFNSDYLSVTLAQLVAIGCIVFLTYINSRGIQNGKMIQLVFTSAKLIALFGLIIFGIAVGLKGNVLWDNFKHAWDASFVSLHMEGNSIVKEWMPLSGLALLGMLGSTIIGPLFSSDAWNNVTFIAGEIENPKRNIPLSLFWGTMIVTVIYILANIAYLSLLPLEGNYLASDVMGKGMQYADIEFRDGQIITNDRVGTAAVSLLFGDIAKYLMAALIMVSTFGCNNGIILAGGRLFQTMAKDELFFKKAAELNDKNVPANALWAQCIWASILCLSGKYGDLLTYATFASLIFYVLTIIGLFVLRRKEPDAERPYRAFGYPVIPLIYIIVTTAICVDLVIYQQKNTVMGLFIVALGLPVYYIWQEQKKKKKSRL